MSNNPVVKNIDIDVESSPSSVPGDDEQKPVSFNLYQNYPNPFNPTTEIKYSILNDGFTTLKIYDMLGREVKTLVNEEKPAGIYNVYFDASKLSSGIYFYSITSGSFHQTRKMVLAK